MSEIKKLTFAHANLTCDVDAYMSGRNISLRFYDASIEQKPEDMVNAVNVNDALGYLNLKFISEDAIIDGFLIATFFKDVESVEAAIDFLQELSPEARGVCTPYRVSRVNVTDYVRYNGEY